MLKRIQDSLAIFAFYCLSCLVLKEAGSTAMDDRLSTADVRSFFSAAVSSSELNDDDLVSLSVMELNYRLKSVSPSERLRLKKRRRTLNNRRHQQTYQKRHPERRRRRKYALHHTDDAPVAEADAEVAVFCDCESLVSILLFILYCIY